MGAIAFTALAQGLLTNKYLDGARDVQRAAHRPTFNAAVLTEETLARVRGLNGIAKGRGQTLAQMALVWVLRDPRIASTLVGTSSVEQLKENLAALDQPGFTAEELSKIDRYAVDSGIDLWRSSSDL
jgi:L-glyceraldehyde 3-phosphate reductase